MWVSITAIQSSIGVFELQVLKRAFMATENNGLCHSSDGQSLASHCGRLDSIQGHVRFVVGKVALGEGFSKYLGFPYQFSFHRLLHTHHHHPGLVQYDK
jgi:hypothetical protein